MDVETIEQPGSLQNLHRLKMEQDARAFKYMSEATINTSCFIWKLIFFWVGIFRLGWEFSVMSGNFPFNRVSHFPLMSGPFMPNLMKIGL